MVFLGFGWGGGGGVFCLERFFWGGGEGGGVFLGPLGPGGGAAPGGPGGWRPLLGGRREKRSITATSCRTAGHNAADIKKGEPSGAAKRLSSREGGGGGGRGRILWEGEVMVPPGRAFIVKVEKTRE